MTREVLVPQYLNNFKCIGSTCEDSCCSGWRVTVDEETYKKYRKSNHVDLKPKFKRYIKRQRSQSSTVNYAKIKMDVNNSCSFLTEKKLCGIQEALGEEYLSNTCFVYPRIINRVNDTIEKSLTMSCPEAARLALLNSEPLQFDQIEEPSSTKGYIMSSINQNNKKDEIKNYFWDLRIFSIRLIQNRSYTIEERMILLGMFFQNLERKIEDNFYNEILSTIKLFEEMISEKEFEKSLANIPSNLKIQMKLCDLLVNTKITKGVSNKRYLECLNEMIEGIQVAETSEFNDNVTRYNQLNNDFYQPFMKGNSHIIENYIVNYIFKNLFPLEKKNLFENYIMLVVHYSLIKIHLIGMSGYHKGLSSDLVIKLIQSFAKTVEHDKVYLNNVLKFFKTNDLDNMAYMSVLIKN